MKKLFRSLANYNIEKYIKNSLNGLGFEVNENIQSTVTQLIRNSIGNNPRSINRLFNSVSLLMNIIESSEEGSNDNQSLDSKLLILAMVCFQLRFEEAYNYILSSYNNSPEDTEKTELFLISLLENTFELSEDRDNSTLNSCCSNVPTMSERDFSDFNKFYKNLKTLLGADKILKIEQFERLLDKMTLSNTVATGNTDVVVGCYVTQNHKANEDVQYVYRKLFNSLVKKNHFDLDAPQNFGMEDKEKRIMPISSEFIKIQGEYDYIRLTQGKGQGIYIFSHQHPSNNIYSSGDTHGNMNNDGMSICIDNKRIDQIKKTCTGTIRQENYVTMTKNMMSLRRFF